MANCAKAGPAFVKGVADALVKPANGKLSPLPEGGERPVVSFQIDRLAPRRLPVIESVARHGQRAIKE